MLLIPTIGTTAKFVFSAPFADLSGIYTLTTTLSFDTAVADGVNLFTSFYELADVSKETFDATWTTYKTDTILRLVSVTDPTVVIYAPSLALAKVPDPQILKCYNLFIAIDLGVFKDADDVSYMVDQLNDIAAGVSGTENTTQLYTSEIQWMSAADYQAIVDERAERITGMDLQSRIIQEQNATIQRMQTLVAAYEATLIALQSS